MRVFVGTIQNSNDNTLRYRVLDLENKSFSDFTAEQLKGIKGVRNISIQNGTVVCTEGKLSDYPSMVNDNVENNLPIVVDIVSNTEVTIANIGGKVATLKTRDVLAKLNVFANAVQKGTTIQFKSKATDNNLSLYNEIMKAESIPVDIQSFNMLDHFRKLGVSDNIFKSPDIIFSSSEERKVESDTSAYKLEIVKVEDRVELRKYEGDKYSGLVIIPDDVTHICEEAFYRANCTEVQMGDNVRYLGDRAFHTSKIRKITLSNRITAIPLECFFNSDLEEINLENITSIDNLAFFKTHIKEVHLKSNIIQIGFDAFSGCSKLCVFEHAKTIQKIRREAFRDCINLIDFDFESVKTIELRAFNNTGIRRATVNGEVEYLQTGTFTGAIEEIVILDGMYKLAADCVSNKENKPITWTLPKSVTNIEKGAFKSKDTVVCYRKSVSASSAIIAEANIVYIDDLDKSSIPSVIKKAALVDASVDDILRKTLEKIIEAENTAEVEFEIDESKLVRANIIEPILTLIDADNFASHKYATDEDIANERIKFKCILKHLYRCAPFDITPFSSFVLELRDTFRIDKTDKNEVQTIYNDGISSVHRIVYIDNKFQSINSSFLVAKTYDTLRYICMDNKYTDIMCENPEVQDMSELLKILRPGDTIGLNNVVSGVKYPEIFHESKKDILVTKNGVKLKQKLKMNMYQALRYSSVTLRLDNNNIALYIPGNNTIIKCASLGRTAWLNEKEETYKSLQCTIDTIENIDSCTVFDFESTYRSSNVGALLTRFKSLKPSQYSQYNDMYSHIYKAEQSMYKKAGEYAYINGMNSIYDVDLDFMLKLFETSLFEERKDDWLDGSKGKTIVPDAQYEFELADGSTIYQYRNVKRIALRNKLMRGGDRKLYVFELVDSAGYIEGIYISLYDIVSLLNMCLSVNKQSDSKDKQIFKNKEHFDTVAWDDVIEISTLCKGDKIGGRYATAQFILAVYKPNGAYYIGLKVERHKLIDFIPIVQIGELDVALEFIEYTNKFGIGNPSMKYLLEGSLGIMNYYVTEVIGVSEYSRYSQAKYLGLLKARQLCIEGISDIKSFNSIGIPEVLKRCMGYTDSSIDYYAVQKPNVQSNLPDLTDISDDDFDIDESDL